MESSWDAISPGGVIRLLKSKKRAPTSAGTGVGETSSVFGAPGSSGGQEWVCDNEIHTANSKEGFYSPGPIQADVLLSTHGLAHANSEAHGPVTSCEEAVFVGFQNGNN